MMMSLELVVYIFNICDPRTQRRLQQTCRLHKVNKGNSATQWMFMKNMGYILFKLVQVHWCVFICITTTKLFTAGNIVTSSRIIILTYFAPVNLTLRP